MFLVGSVADSYHVDTDPGYEKICYGSGSRTNFNTDPDSGKNDTDPNPFKKGITTGLVPGNFLKCEREKTLISHVLFMYITVHNNHFSIKKNHLN